MPRFFIDKNDISDNTVCLTGENAHHIFKVLRMKCGDKISLCDGNGMDYEAEICEITKNESSAKIISSNSSKTEPPVKITVFQALPKASKMEYIIQKCTELGFCEIIPCIMERCVVKLDSTNSESKKIERWQSVAEAAAKQSERGIVPKVANAVHFNDAVNMLKEYDLCFVPYEHESHGSLKKILQESSNAKSIAFLIGPEGGISDDEIDKLTSSDIPTVTLGPRILRTETAAMAVISMIMYELGDINPKDSF